MIETQNIVPAIIQNITRPDFMFLNLNPATREKSNNEDFTSTIIAWILLLVYILIGIFVIRRIF